MCYSCDSYQNLFFEVGLIYLTPYYRLAIIFLHAAPSAPSWTVVHLHLHRRPILQSRRKMLQSIGHVRNEHLLSHIRPRPLCCLLYQSISFEPFSCIFKDTSSINSSKSIWCFWAVLPIQALAWGRKDILRLPHPYNRISWWERHHWARREGWCTLLWETWWKNADSSCGNFLLNLIFKTK